MKTPYERKCEALGLNRGQLQAGFIPDESRVAQVRQPTYITPPGGTKRAKRNRVHKWDK